jgi:hypothetical protein
MPNINILPKNNKSNSDKLVNYIEFDFFKAIQHTVYYLLLIQC